MIPVLATSIIFATLGSAQRGPYTVSYYQASHNGNLGCSPRLHKLQCFRIPAFECCEAPPGRQYFPHAKAESGGETGFVSFHTTDSSGDCLGCTAGGVLGDCYNNSPFEPISVYPLNHKICETPYNDNPSRNKRTMSDVKDKIPIVEGTGGEASVPKVCNKINAISIQGVSYYLNTDLNEEFMNDFHNMPGEEIIKKYALVEADVVDGEGKGQTPQDKQSS